MTEKKKPASVFRKPWMFKLKDDKEFFVALHSELHGEGGDPLLSAYGAGRTREMFKLIPDPPEFWGGKDRASEAAFTQFCLVGRNLKGTIPFHRSWAFGNPSTTSVVSQSGRPMLLLQQCYRGRTDRNLTNWETWLKDVQNQILRGLATTIAPGSIVFMQPWRMLALLALIEAPADHPTLELHPWIRHGALFRVKFRKWNRPKIVPLNLTTP